MKVLALLILIGAAAGVYLVVQAVTFHQDNESFQADVQRRLKDMPWNRADDMKAAIRKLALPYGIDPATVSVDFRRSGHIPPGSPVGLIEDAYPVEKDVLEATVRYQRPMLAWSQDYTLTATVLRAKPVHPHQSEIQDALRSVLPAPAN
jgi:hypothetical protein